MSSSNYSLLLTTNFLVIVIIVMIMRNSSIIRYWICKYLLQVPTVIVICYWKLPYWLPLWLTGMQVNVEINYPQSSPMIQQQIGYIGYRFGMSLQHALAEKEPRK